MSVFLHLFYIYCFTRLLFSGSFSPDIHESFHATHPGPASRSEGHQSGILCHIRADQRRWFVGVQLVFLHGTVDNLLGFILLALSVMKNVYCVCVIFYKYQGWVERAVIWLDAGSWRW